MDNLSESKWEGARSRKLTEKGLQYQLELKGKQREHVYKKLCDVTQRIQEKMQGSDTDKDVHLLYSHWMSLFEQLDQVYSDYSSFLPHDQQENDRENWLSPKLLQLHQFKSTLESWFVKVKEAKTYGESTVFKKSTSNCGSVKATSHKSRSVSQSGSVVSSQSIISARLKEQQKLAELKVKAKTLKQLQILEKEKLQLKRQEEEKRIQEDEQRQALKQREEELKMETEIAIAAARCNVVEQIARSQGQSVHSDECLSEDGLLQNGEFHTAWCSSKPKAAAVVPSFLDRNDAKETEVDKGFMSPVDQTLMSVVRHIKKPSSSVRKFGGNPLEYQRFMRQFHSCVVSNCDDDDEKLNFLDHYTYGEANKIVAGYSQMQAERGYKAILAEFKRRYGNIHVVVNAYVKKVLNWPVIKQGNEKDMDELSLFLCECKNAVEGTEAIKVLEYPDNMKKIVQKLPYYMQTKWQNMVYKTKEKGEVIDFSLLTSFIRGEADRLNDPIWGREALDEGQRSTRRIVTSTHSKKTSFATEIDNTIHTACLSDPNKQDQGIRHPATRKFDNKGKHKYCWYCSDISHAFDNCSKFSTLLFKEKLDILKEKGLCFGCLKPGHQKKFCRNKAVCEQCNRRHPTVMHTITSEKVKDLDSDVTVKSVNTNCVEEVNDDLSTCTDSVCSSMGAGTSQCTMPIIPVVVRPTNSMKEITTYAFLDSGSSVSFCSEDLLHRMGISGKKVKITVNTMGTPHQMTTNVVNGLEILDIDMNNVIKLPVVYSKDKLPVSKIHIPVNEDIAHLRHLKHVSLPEIDSAVDLLIGNNVPDAYSPLEVFTGPCGTPHVSRTLLGLVPWNVIRNKEESSCSSVLVNRTEIMAIEEFEDINKLGQLYQKQIDMDFPEKVVDDKKEWSVEDHKFMEKTVKSICKRQGHYEIALPFKRDIYLPDNRSYVLHRLKGLERRFQKQKDFFADYKVFMSNIIEKGYAEIVPEKELNRNDGKVWYIPHHGIYHPKKPDKIRVVFDCTSKFQGVSLNSSLFQGPDITNNLIGVLLRFREEFIALMADIEAMFYQVRVPKEDCDCLRFFWWPDGNLDKQPKVYRMVVHIFGAVSSPTCANMALHKTAESNKRKYPEACETLLRNFYVDDCLKSVSSEDKAIKISKELYKVCESGGFKLTKWCSNSRNVLQTIPKSEHAKNIIQLDLTKDTLPGERALGVFWSVEKDVFSFSIALKEMSETKRHLLAVLSTIYDPLGLAAPVILQARMLMQELCKLKIDWDEQIPESVAQKWRKWLKTIPSLEKLSIPRCVKPNDFGEVTSIELHSFSDASESGYGVVMYLRFVNDEGCVHCSFLLSKTRVAPLKKITIPRLELSAATLSVRLVSKVMKELDNPIAKVYYWTDSMSVIRYIVNEATRFHTFVANRLSVIREASSVDQWRYVDSKNNPADDASRGLTPKDLLESQRWFSGPDFLWASDDCWKKPQSLCVQIPQNDIELKSVHTVSSAICQQSTSVLDYVMVYFSDWLKLRRCVAWILHGFSNLSKWVKTRKEITEKISKTTKDLNKVNEVVDIKMRIFKKELQAQSKEKLKTVSLSVDMLEQAEIIIIKHEQERYMSQEVEDVAAKCGKGLSLKRSSKFLRLNPILTNGVVRVGGRLQKASISYEARHPAIIPKESPIAKLILCHIHKITGHMGKNSMLSALRQRYWIIKAGSMIKSIISKCVICRRYQGRVGEQMMSVLPENRLKADEPVFSRSGVDYFGPIEVKRGRVTVKRYGVIFTCFASRAVHLEMAHSLDTSSCINAIRRFLARRGNVISLLSDNGTNFVGAEKELKEECKRIDTSKLQSVLSNKGIEWSFNPPSASHFGGVWERMIRSTRKIMYALMKEQNIKFDDESLQTLFCEVENILNSRPLTKTSQDACDLEVLTPNHLLLLKASSFPCGVFDKDDLYTRRRWRQVQYIVDQFWKRWSVEYLHTLQERQKWFQQRRNISVGDVVLIVDNNLRCNWALGKVLMVHPDKAGLVRSVTLKTRSSVLQRPIHKLCLLLEAEI